MQGSFIIIWTEPTWIMFPQSRPSTSSRKPLPLTDSVNKAFAPMTEAFAPMTESVNKAFAPMTESVNKFVQSFDSNYHGGAVKLSDEQADVENPPDSGAQDVYPTDGFHYSHSSEDVHNPMTALTPPPVYATLLSDDDFAPSTSYDNAPGYSSADAQGQEDQVDTNVISPFHSQV